MFAGARKEITIAVIVGILTGIIFSYLLFRLSQKGSIDKSFKEGKVIKEEKRPTTVTKPKATIKEKAVINQLTIDSPADETFLKKPKVTLTGKAPKESLVFIMTEANPFFVDLKEKENFSTEVDLIEGDNNINIKAILKDGREQDLNLTLIYEKE